jgi:thiol:disulfide interchange protein
MAKGVRVPERAYGIAMWVVSVVLAAFIVGLGNLVIGDLPQVEQSISQDQFADSAATRKIDAELKAISARSGAIDDKLEIARLQLEQARTASQTGTETFQAWIQTRTATTNPQQDPEVVARTRALEQLKGNERSVQASIDALESERVPMTQRESALRDQQSRLQASAYPAYEKAMFWQELRIFGLRLLITLPMLLVAGWLVVKKRKSDHWPMMRGFVLASVFVFFVELVPYLPSYGGYIRYAVGIALTIVAGHFLVKNMRAYLAKRQEVEQQAEEERRKLVTHDEAFKKMAAKQCPGCDRPIAAMDGAETNFCVHCGMTLYNQCGQCKTRKMAFFRFCVSCGTPAEQEAKAAA